jgi:hypothetical protein
MMRLRIAVSGRLERHELEQAEAAHELRDRRQTAALFAELAVHGRQGRKDRGELPRHGRGLPWRRAEEEFDALPRLAHAA